MHQLIFGFVFLKLYLKGVYMGGMWFNPEILADSLSETVGYKSGLALSLDDMCDLLSDTDYPDVLVDSESSVIRIRSEEYEDLFYSLLHCVGVTEKKHDYYAFLAKEFRKYRGTKKAKIYYEVIKIMNDYLILSTNEVVKSGSNNIDPTPFIDKCIQEYDDIGLVMAVEHLEILDAQLRLSPHTCQRYVEWENCEKLESLFKGNKNTPEIGTFIDQRFIDYLNANPEKIGEIHWRKFEELTAEYFTREGFKVDLGPGSNDDGVDVRVWKDSQDKSCDPPLYIIQCKRQKKKVEKVVIKGLYSDIQFEKADYGLIVTSSELSVGAKQTIQIRGYPIQEIDGRELRKWLKVLHKSGTGIVRS